VLQRLVTEPELDEEVRDVLLDRRRRHLEVARDAVIGLALVHQRQHLLLAAGQPLKRVVAALAADHLGDDEKPR
jgi:hypothetical protein